MPKNTKFNSRDSSYQKYTHVYFRRRLTNKKTDTWDCVNIKTFETIGVVKWFARWRQYCYYPGADTVYSASCLNDIQQFTADLQSEYKERRKDIVDTPDSKVVLRL